MDKIIRILFGLLFLMAGFSNLSIAQTNGSGEAIGGGGKRADAEPCTFVYINRGGEINEYLKQINDLVKKGYEVKGIKGGEDGLPLTKAAHFALLCKRID